MPTATTITLQAATYLVAVRDNQICGTAHGDGHGLWDVYDRYGNDYGQDVSEDEARAILAVIPWPLANDKPGTKVLP